MVTATSGAGATVSKMYVDNTEVAKGTGSSNWGVSSGTVTIKTAYLATLSAGEHTVKFKFSADNEVTLSLTVEDTTE